MLLHTHNEVYAQITRNNNSLNQRHTKSSKRNKLESKNCNIFAAFFRRCQDIYWGASDSVNLKVTVKSIKKQCLARFIFVDGELWIFDFIIWKNILCAFATKNAMKRKQKKHSKINSTGKWQSRVKTISVFFLHTFFRFYFWFWWRIDVVVVTICVETTFSSSWIWIAFFPSLILSVTARLFLQFQMNKNVIHLLFIESISFVDEIVSKFKWIYFAFFIQNFDLRNYHHRWLKAD